MKDVVNRDIANSSQLFDIIKQDECEDAKDKILNIDIDTIAEILDDKGNFTVSVNFLKSIICINKYYSLVKWLIQLLLNLNWIEDH